MTDKLVSREIEPAACNEMNGQRYDCIEVSVIPASDLLPCLLFVTKTRKMALPNQGIDLPVGSRPEGTHQPAC